MIIVIDRINERYIESFKRGEKIGIEIKCYVSEYMEEYRDRFPVILVVKNWIITEIKEVL